VLAAKALGFRVVFHLHEMPQRIGWLLRKAIGTADGVVYCSETCAAHFAGVPARLNRTIVNAMQFNERPPVRHKADNHRIVMVGSINRKKGQDLLLKAFTKLQDSKAELWLYGSTGLSAHKYIRDLKRFAVQHGVSDRVFFRGPIVDVFAVFADAAVVAHTSWTESFGMALMEAQSCGIPVVAHDLEGMREVVVDGVTGFLVKPGNVDELAERLDTLLSDPDLRNRMGEGGFRMVRERFSVDSRLPEYIALYQEVCLQ
jgi:glycosyltransferase involved in cell wall biosynthesis